MVNRPVESILISEIGLKTRTFNAIMNWTNIRRVDELMIRTPEQLLNIKHFGRVCLRDVRLKLKRLGLDLRTDEGSDDAWSWPVQKQGEGFVVVHDPLELVSAPARLTNELVKGWDADKALVLADWCEEREFMGAAEDLRKGPSMRTRAFIEFLAFMFGLVEPPRRQHWELGWLPGCEQAASCFIPGCSGRVSFRRIDTDEAYCDAHYIRRPVSDCDLGLTKLLVNSRYGKEK